MGEREALHSKVSKAVGSWTAVLLLEETRQSLMGETTAVALLGETPRPHCLRFPLRSNCRSDCAVALLRSGDGEEIAAQTNPLAASILSDANCICPPSVAASTLSELLLPYKYASNASATNSVMDLPRSRAACLIRSYISSYRPTRWQILRPLVEGLLGL
jgi:hypothetical protein